MCTPGDFIHSIPFNHMKSHLLYAISRRTPPSEKTWKEIDEVQKALNHRLTWTNERLSLTREQAGTRPGYAFPFVQIMNPLRAPSPSVGRERPDDAPRIADAFATGSTRVRDNLWNAHLVAAFLRFVSARYPELTLQLRDDGGFVLPGAVWIKGGQVSLDTDWLNRARARALETTGDVESAMPFLWAEHEALEGRFFAAGSVFDYSEVPEVREFSSMVGDEHSFETLEGFADVVVDTVASKALERVPA